MCPYWPRAISHQRTKASTQKSLVSRWPKNKVSAPVASTRMPSGVHLRTGGGSWSQPLGACPRESVRLFPPAGVVALVHLRLGVDGDLQRLRVALDLLSHRGEVGEDGVGVLGLPQGLGLDDALEPVVHAVEDVPQGPRAGQVLARVALLLQRLADLRRRQVGVAPRRLQLGVGLGMRLDDGADVLGQLRVLGFPALLAAGGKVLQTAEAVLLFLQALADGVAPPAKAALGLARAAATQRGRDLGYERTALVAGQAAGRGTDQDLVRLGGRVHDRCLSTLLRGY